MYRSVAKKGQLTKEHPPPTFGPISCIGSKFTWMSAHPGASFAWCLRRTSLSTMRISGKKLRVILHQGIFAWTDVANEVSIPKVVLRLTASYSMRTITSYSSECCVPSRLDFEAAGDYIVCYFVSNYLLWGLQVAVNMTWTLFYG